MGLTLVCAAKPLIYDATADFTPDLPNPNGVWAYGYTTDLSAALTPFAGYSSDATAFGWSTNLALGTPAIFKVTGSFNGLAPGQLALHPGPSGEYAVLAFSVPAAGHYVLNAQFLAGDSGETDAAIVFNFISGSTPVVLPFGSTNGNPVLTNFDLFLDQGDQVRFAVGSFGSFLSDSTPVTATLTFSPVPEPGAFALLLGLGGMATALVRRRRLS
jgi:hypothetical protein